MDSTHESPAASPSSGSLRRPSHSHRGDKVIFCCPEFDELARELCAMDKQFLQGKITWGSFEDGFPNINIHDWANHLRGKHVVFLASFMLEHSETAIFDQLSVMYSIPKYLTKSLTILLPYFPTGTMERIEQEGQIATAKTLAQILSATPECHGTGPAQIVMFDIHALQERFYFSDNIIPVLLTAIPLFLDAIRHEKDVAIAFPDEGARKRFGRMFDGKYPLIVCSKVRQGDKGRVVRIAEGEARGMKVFIVDDLVKTGGTLLQCKKALLEAGAASVSAFVTHGVFPQESWKRFVPSSEGGDEGEGHADQGFKVFYVTNSCPQMARILSSKRPFRVLSLAPALYDFLRSEESTKHFGG